MIEQRANTKASEPEVTDNVERSRFELALPGGTAFLDYQRRGNVRVLTHAEVPPSMRGAGVAARLTAGALQLLRARGERALPRCAYVVRFMERERQFDDLRAPGLPGA